MYLFNPRRSELKPIPWNHVHDWTCIRCGSCCKYTVQLTTFEWLKLTQQYGFRIANNRLDGFYLRKTVDNRCPFLYSSYKGHICGLQRTKPLACKLWPFRVRSEPLVKEQRDGYFRYHNHTFFIYVNPQCPGLTYGKPTQAFQTKILPEFLNIRLGTQHRQFYTTAKAP
jgi:Fe-S-cluster containining protein